MSELTFVSTTSTPAQMRADLDLPDTAPVQDAQAGSVAVRAADTPPAPDRETPAEPDAQAETPAAPVAAAPTPGEPTGDDTLTGEEYPELGGMTAEDFANLPKKTQRRIAKLTRRVRETEARLTALTPPASAPAPPTPPAPPAAALEPPAGAPATTDLPPGFRAKPESDAFETWAEYEEALVDWKIDLRDAKRALAEEQTTRQRQEAEARQAAETTLSAFTKRRDQVKAERADWDEVVTDDPITVDDPRKLSDLERLVVEATDAEGVPLGPELQYHLGKHRADLDRLLQAKTPLQLATRFGALVRDVELARGNGHGETPAPVVRPLPKVTAAPAPVRPVAGASSMATTDLDDSLSQSEWERRREAQLRARRPG